MPIRVDPGQPWKQTETWLKKLQNGDIFSHLDSFGQRGVSALAAATPIESGETAASWSYEVVRKNGYYSIRWFNTHVENGAPIAIMLQYGHGTGTGGYVEGRDYINPAIRPIFDQIEEEFRKAVTG